LFTGNNLMISSAMTKKITFRTMSVRWAVVWFANLIGSLILALIFYFSGLWKTGNGALGASAVAIAYMKVNLSFVEALVRAIGCNWLVCLAVWMALWAGIAAPAAFDPVSLNWISFLWKNMVPVTIGNIIGGAVFVGMSYWGAYLRPVSGNKIGAS